MPRGRTETVPVPRHQVEGGIVSCGALVDILTAARAAIDRHTPEAIVALGGDCFVEPAVIAWQSERYGDELAVLSVDVHPDVMGAAETASAHAHVVALLVGEGDRRSPPRSGGRSTGAHSLRRARGTSPMEAD
jgi:arginase